MDLRNLRALRTELGDDVVLMTDANQALTLEAAIALAKQAASLNLPWLEEPMRVDVSAVQCAALAQASPIPLADGENLRGEELQVAAEGDVLRAVQPDMTKWGGFTGNLPIARTAVAWGKSFCPHVFGGGIALLASLHLLAAVGGDGLLEFDCHPNAGRELIVGSLLPVQEGHVPVPQGVGLGVVPQLTRLERFRTWPAS